jgi:nucleoside-diphosphate-sugar epimerase
MNILITGAFGFVGTNLSRALAAAGKHRLTALDMSEPPAHNYNEFYTWPELDKLSGKPLDAIIHLAGKAHDTGNTAAEQEYFDINLGLTQKIFEFFLQSEAKKFIFFSSVKAAADTVQGDSLTETVEPSPGTPYGRSKLAAENYLLGKPESYRTSHTMTKQLYILRPCMIHGPGNKGNLNLLYKLASKGIPWPLGAYENRRSFTSIANLSFVINQLLTKDVPSGIYNMADDEPLSTNRLIELIAESREKQPRIWNISRKWIHLAAKPGDVLPLPLNSERLKKLTESYVVSNAKLKKALGIQTMPVSAEEGMKETLESFK